MEEEFIENVRMYKFLYDVHCQSYRDAGMRTAAWEEIGKGFDMTGEECKTLWTKLRNAYTNAIKRRRAASGQLGRKIGKWKFEDQMAFVLPYMDTRTLTRNSPSLPRISAENATMNEHDYTDVESDELEKATTTLMTNSASLQESSPFQMLKHAYRIPSIKRKADKDVEEIVEVSNSKDTPVTSSGPQHRQGNIAQDEVEMFYLSMARTIKQLPKIEQVKIRMQFCNMVSEAEIKNFPKNDSPKESCATTSTTSSPIAEATQVILITDPNHEPEDP